MNTFLRYCTICFIFFAGCDQGLAPIAVSPGFSGAIIYKSQSPPSDSLLDLRIIAVPNYPIDSSFQSIFSKVISGEIAYSPYSLSTAHDTTTYSMYVEPKTYFYVAVMQKYGLQDTDWRVVGIYGYSTASPAPKSVTVSEREFTEGIDINVDFYNLPPQPFKK